MRYALPLTLILALARITSLEAQSMTIEQHADVCTLQLDGKDIARFAIPQIKGGPAPEVTVTEEDDGWQRVRMAWQLEKPIQQDELAVRFELRSKPDFWWAPHLAPNEGDCIAQHVFRSPAIIAMQGKSIFAIVPDLDICGANEANPWFMDFDAPARTVWLGMTRTKIIAHVQYHKAPGMTLGPGKIELGFYVAAYTDDADPPNPFSCVSRFLWRRWGHPLFVKGEPTTVPMDTYVKRTHEWAFDTWGDVVWQEFDLDAVRVGAPQFIVNVTESPGYTGEREQREVLSIWNQAWFSSLRSASGVMRSAIRTGDKDLRRRAELTKAFALAAPMKQGIFPGVYRTEMTEVEIGGRKYHRAKGWETGYWCNSNRTPRERGITDQWYHILDANWTALLMLRWHQDIEPDARLVDYAKTYADALLKMQDERGFFPAWLHPETLEPSDVLADSPETSMSVTFLLKLAEVTGDDRYRRPAIRALDAVLREIVPGGRWEDYETYWSCCQWGKEEFLGARIPRNAMYKQNTLSIFWTAEALLEAYRATREDRYLRWGQRTLDELSMFQQIWQPPYMYIPTLGGFGVMNFDAEWNDARQSLFCELFMDYYRETGDPDLFERGVAALKSGFVMMYCPENPRVKALYEKAWPFFGAPDYGFMMENYGHRGEVNREGGGIGNFTIYDWGNGAASEARCRVFDHYGDVYIDRPRKQAFGIDSVAVTLDGGVYTLSDLAGAVRDVKVVFEDGTSRTVRLDGTAALE